VRRLGTKHGGVYVDGIGFRYQGGQVRSLLSLVSYLGSGEYREKYLGVKIPPTNIQDHHLEQARALAGKLADQLSPTESDAPASPSFDGITTSASEPQVDKPQGFGSIREGDRDD
jgi:hypothetical protein